MIGMISRWVSLAAFLMIAQPAVLAAQEALIVSPRPTGPVTFQGIPPNLTAASGETLVLNPEKTSLEEPALPGQWPSSLHYFFDTPSGKSICSATLIGPRTLVTASHCVPNTKFVSISFQGATIDSEPCTEIGGFAEPKSMSDVDDCQAGKACPTSRDIALCLLKRAPSVTKFETISREQPFSTGQRLRVTGFGCIKPNYTGGTQTNKPVFSIGWVSVLRPPNGGDSNLYLIAGAAKDMVGAPVGQPASSSEVCPGDSGGGTYLMGQNPTNLSWRRLVAINSGVRQEMRDGAWRVVGPSFFVALSVPGVSAILDSWANRAGAEICGINAPDVLCR